MPCPPLPRTSPAAEIEIDPVPSLRAYIPWRPVTDPVPTEIDMSAPLASLTARMPAFPAAAPCPEMPPAARIEIRPPPALKASTPLAAPEIVPLPASWTNAMPPVAELERAKALPEEALAVADPFTVTDSVSAPDAVRFCDALVVPVQVNSAAPVCTQAASACPADRPRNAAPAAEMARADDAVRKAGPMRPSAGA